MDITTVAAGDEWFGPAAALFDDYRAHYGQPAEPERTRAWLADQLTAGRLEMTVAGRDGGTAGMITTLVQPASLRLGTFWSVRDLFVAPEHRRGGVAHALLDHVAGRARAAGALRVSLQTETGNGPAHALYASRGFRPVAGLDLLSLSLE